MKTAKQILLDAAELLSHRGAWTRDAMARDRNNEPVNVRHEDACKFCALGAIERSAFYYDGKWHGDEFDLSACMEVDRARTALRDEIKEKDGSRCWSIPLYNDQRKRRARDIVALMKKAAKKL